MRAIILLAGLCGIVSCSERSTAEFEVAAARERYSQLVRSVECPATSVECPGDNAPPLVTGHSSLDSRLLPLDSRLSSLNSPFTRYASPCVLVFVGPHCAPCVTAVRDFVPRLQARGWRVYVLDERTEQPAFAACDVEAKPTFICLRRGIDCGRSIGADWPALCAMLRAANEYRFVEDRDVVR